MRNTLWLTGLVMLVAACSSITQRLNSNASSDDDALSSPRCYRMSIGTWSSTGQPMGLVPPGDFRLDPELSTRQFAPTGARLVHPAFATERTTRFPAEWNRAGTDSVIIRWNTGFQQGGYRLQLRGDSAIGIATTWTDMRTGTPDPVAQASGRQVPCQASDHENSPGATHWRSGHDA